VVSLIKKTIENVVKNDLCTGCGVCEDVCPQGAIHFSLQDGLSIPKIDKAICINHKGCNRCYQICSGVGMNLRGIAKTIFTGNLKSDYYAGSYQNAYAGFSNNYDIRFHSASGGMISQFLIFLLEKGFINGAIITKFRENSPTSPISFIATTEEEIMNGKSSKYCPVSLNGLISEINMLKGKYIVVGLPCHIQGFRKYELMYPKFREKIVGYFSTYCSSIRTFNGTDYLFSHYKIDKTKILSFSYRDDGCMGYMKITTEGEIIKIPYREYFQMLKSFFKPKRCLYCIDHYGDLADVSFGDIQTGRYRKDKIGINSIISRNSKLDKLLIQAKNENFIDLEKIELSTIHKSQRAMLSHKRRISGLNIQIEKRLGNETPNYDIQLQTNYSLIDYIAYLTIKVQRQIGKRRYLWPLIDVYNVLFALIKYLS